MSESSDEIYVPQYLRNTDDRQLHAIADWAETVIEKLSTAQKERDQLRAQCEGLAEALDNFFNLLDSQFLVRNIGFDGSPDWAMKCIKPIIQLREAQDALSKYRESVK